MTRKELDDALAQVAAETDPAKRYILKRKLFMFTYGMSAEEWQHRVYNSITIERKA